MSSNTAALVRGAGCVWIPENYLYPTEPDGAQYLPIPFPTPWPRSYLYNSEI